MDILMGFELVNPLSEMISFVGGGGKTTTMFSLATKLKEIDKKILVTTTTAIYYPSNNELFDEIFLTDQNDLKQLYSIKEGQIYLLGSSVSKEGKLLGVNPILLEEIYNMKIFDVILVEADGSKGRPIKAPAKHEPVVPPSTTKYIGVIGLDALFMEINSDIVHRIEEFTRIVEANIGDIIMPSTAARLITHPEGLFKNIPSSNCQGYVLLNKGEGEGFEAGREIIRLLEDNAPLFKRIIIGSMKYEKDIKFWRDFN
ncbi:selenium cofactor biosynthesis protein YqeC [Alkaliphilus peptidifermentans]|uniref:Probable selenium-dependent hydroxylase accessory protein YqeC n=1 Tax=Alkaliphilus peptidifermentans DSM 18978 TaxID=1120976 RepID=A0A1G5KYB9_9FIRM|nr:selenium cofactor biosynthesis protein YqeC [Alkaliphilus peptidifermentans]SCZ05344.1 probable selenium-dependent hydroxylase accessory protein YqeC [Alkaliphilus peptidifermentans DSM 18978]